MNIVFKQMFERKRNQTKQLRSYKFVKTKRKSGIEILLEYGANCDFFRVMQIS